VARWWWCEFVPSGGREAGGEESAIAARGTPPAAPVGRKPRRASLKLRPKLDCVAPWLQLHHLLTNRQPIIIIIIMIIIMMIIIMIT